MLISENYRNYFGSFEGSSGEVVFFLNLRKSLSLSKRINIREEFLKLKEDK